MEKARDDGDNFCPLCTEEMDPTDKQLKPCKCGYEVCVWCWHQITEMAQRDNLEGRCPACRTPYNKEKIVGMSARCRRQIDVKSEKRHRRYKSKIKITEERNSLRNVRVIQKNLVYIAGMPASLADEKTLECREFFGQYGNILKVSIARSRSHSAQDSATGSTVNVYITFVKEENATCCIQAVNGYILEGSLLRACYGATKYCYSWLKNVRCKNPDCLFLHDLGIEEDTFAKEEMASKRLSKNQQFYGLTSPSQQCSGHCLPPPATEVSFTISAASSKPLGKQLTSGVQAKISLGIETIGKSTESPAAASWGSNTAQEISLPVRTPTVQGSMNPKSNASHSSYMSSPLNLHTSVTAVAPVVPVLIPDHVKPYSTNKGGRRLVSFKSANMNSEKCNATSVRYKALNACVKESCAMSTSQVVNSGQATQGSVTSVINLDVKSETLDGLKNPVKTRSCNIEQDSSEAGSLYVRKIAKTKRTDDVCVSFGTVCGIPKTPLPISAPHRNNEAAVSEINETTVIDSTHKNKIDKSFDTSFPCADFSEDKDEHSPERSVVESRNKCGVKIPVYARHPINYKEQSEYSFTKHGREQRDSQFTPCMDSVHGLADTVISVYGVSSSVRDQRNVKDQSNSKFLKNVIGHGNHNSIGSTYHEVEEKSVPHSTNFTVDSVQHATIESVSDSSHRSARSSIQMATKLDMAKISEIRSDKLNCSNGMRHGILHESNEGGSDGGDNSIISNTLNLNLDCSEYTTVPTHNLARLHIAETDTRNVSSNGVSSFWKLQKSSQSRFLFARSEGSRETSSRSSNPYFTSSSELQLDLLNGKDLLKIRDDYDQVYRVSSHSSVPKMEVFQTISEDNIFCIPSEATGFSVLGRTSSVPPPGFLTQAMAKMPDKYGAFAGSHPHMLGTGASDDVEFIDPAIMAAGKGKPPDGSNCSSSAIHDSHCVGLLPPSVSNDNGSCAFFGYEPYLMPQLNHVACASRLEMSKQRPFFTSWNWESSRQQFMFADQVGDGLTSYLPSQKDAILPCDLVEQTQPILNPQFSQLPFHQSANPLFRSSSVGSNGWNNWNMASSVIGPGIVVGRQAPSLAGVQKIDTNELMDPKIGLIMFPNYSDSVCHKPSLGDFYSQTYM